MREIVLDTETTGLVPTDGHRLIEIGAVELFNHLPTGRVFHSYVNPGRDVPADLGDPVKAGQVLVQLDNEKQQYVYEQQKAALARTLAQYGAADPQHLPEIERTPDVLKAKAELVRRSANRRLRLVKK